MSVQILKLTSGETLVTEVIECTDDIITVLNPLEVKTEHIGRSRSNMVALQWLPLIEKENVIYIREQHVIGMTYAGDDMIDYYKRAIEQILSTEKTIDRIKEEREFYEKLLQMAKQANTTSTMIH